MKEAHTSFSVTNSGVVINPEWPFIGAIPHGSCGCSKGMMEVKLFSKDKEHDFSKSMYLKMQNCEKFVSQNLRIFFKKSILADLTGKLYTTLETNGNKPAARKC